MLKHHHHHNNNNIIIIYAIQQISWDHWVIVIVFSHCYYTSEQKSDISVQFSMYFSGKKEDILHSSFPKCNHQSQIRTGGRAKQNFH